MYKIGACIFDTAKNTDLDTEKKKVCKKRKVINGVTEWIEDPLSTTDESSSCNYLLVVCVLAGAYY